MLATPSASAIIPRVVLSRAELDDVLAEIRERGWALSDELLSLGIRSIAAPVRDQSGRTAAAMNVTVHAAETSSERLIGDYLPLLLEAAAEVVDVVVQPGDAAYYLAPRHGYLVARLEPVTPTVTAAAASGRDRSLM